MNEPLALTGSTSRSTINLVSALKYQAGHLGICQSLPSIYALAATVQDRKIPLHHKQDNGNCLTISLCLIVPQRYFYIHVCVFRVHISSQRKVCQVDTESVHVSLGLEYTSSDQVDVRSDKVDTSQE